MKPEDDEVEIANAICRACEGRSTSAVFMALSLVLGGTAATAKRPDFDGMMRLVERAARFEFDRQRAVQ